MKPLSLYYHGIKHHRSDFSVTNRVRFARLCPLKYNNNVYYSTQITKSMWPTRGPSGSYRPPDGPHVGPMNLAIRVCTSCRDDNIYTNENNVIIWRLIRHLCNDALWKIFDLMCIDVTMCMLMLLFYDSCAMLALYVSTKFLLTYYLISSFSLQFGILSHIKKKTSKHHSGAVTWVPWRLKSSETGLFVQYSHWVKLNTNALHFLPFSRGIHRCPTDYSHKEPVMWQALPCESLICVDHAVCYMVVAEALAQIGTRLSATTIPISRNEKMHPIN